MILLIMPRREIYELEGGPHCGEILWGPSPAAAALELPCGCIYYCSVDQPPDRPIQMQHSALFAAIDERGKRQGQASRQRAPKRGSRRGKAAPQRYQDPDDDIPFALGPELDQ